MPQPSYWRGGKLPQPETIELAEEADIPLLGTEMIMFRRAGGCLQRA